MKVDLLKKLGNQFNHNQKMSVNSGGESVNSGGDHVNSGGSDLRRTA